jgi:acetolactate synthase-1/2/3 large subunit
MIHQPDDIAPVMKEAFETRGPVIVGVHVDYRDNHKLFEMLHTSWPQQGACRG